MVKSFNRSRWSVETVRGTTTGRIQRRKTRAIFRARVVVDGPSREWVWAGYNLAGRAKSAGETFRGTEPAANGNVTN